MSQRSDLEDAYTVECYHCAAEIVDPSRHPRQRYIRHRPCPSCRRLHPDDAEDADVSDQ